MRRLFHILAAGLALPAAVHAQQPTSHTKGTPTGKPTGPLKPGEYWWNPRVSPEFAGKLHDTLGPGATIIVTDQPAVRKASRDFTILANQSN